MVQYCCAKTHQDCNFKHNVYPHHTIPPCPKVLTSTAAEVNARAAELAEKAYKLRMKKRGITKYKPFDKDKAKLHTYEEKDEANNEIIYVVGWRVVVGYVRDGYKHYMPVSNDSGSLFCVCVYVATPKKRNG